MSRLKNILKIYTDDLSYKEVEKLLKNDFPNLYNFYVNRMERPEKAKNRLSDLIRFTINLFLEFLKQLSPIRRLLYTVAVLFFLFAFFENDWQLAMLAFLMLNVLIAFELADKLVVRDELEVARDVQLSLMPKTAPVNDHFEISCHIETAQIVGGDYYDFIPSTNGSGKTFLIIGDISGKGMAGAIHMVQVQSILHSIVHSHNSPKEILSELNSSLLKVFKPGTFFTASMAVMNGDGSIIFSRAGHLPLIHYSKKENSCLEIIPRGMGIGLGGNCIFNDSINECRLQPQSGDILLLFTDGVIETMNQQRNEYGMERLKKLISIYHERDAETIKSILLKDISYFRQSTPPHDDLTFIIIKMT